MTFNPQPLESHAWQSVTGAGLLGEYLQQISTMPLLMEIATRSLELLALSPRERVLEVGCGTGVFLPLLAEAVGEGGEVVGLDKTPLLVEQARERTKHLRGVRVDEGDAYALPYPDDSFDAAHCDRVLMHLGEPASALNEMRRVVRPGGRVVVAEPDWASVVIDSTDHEIMRILMQQANSGIRQSHIGRELNRRLAGVGLSDRRIETVPILCRDYAELVTYGLDLTRALDALAAEGRLDRDRGQAVLDDLAAANSEGTFCAFGGYFVACGRLAPSSE